LQNRDGSRLVKSLDYLKRSSPFAPLFRARLSLSFVMLLSYLGMQRMLVEYAFNLSAFQLSVGDLNRVR
jgi:hypothetical protein